MSVGVILIIGTVLASNDRKISYTPFQTTQPSKDFSMMIKDVWVSSASRFSNAMRHALALGGARIGCSLLQLGLCDIHDAWIGCTKRQEM